MNSWTFSALFVRCYVENEVAVIGMGDDQMNPANFLILTRMLESESATDGVGLQTSRSGREFSNVLVNARLRQHMLSVGVKQEYARAIGASEISVDLSGARFFRAELVDFLRKIFKESSAILEFAD